MELSEDNPGGSFRPGSRDLSEIAATYSRMGNHWVRYDFARRFCQDSRVLDLGCGHGTGFLLLRDNCRQYVGADVDLSALEWARVTFADEPSHPLFVREHDLSDPKWRGYFDVVVSFETIEHVKNPSRHLVLIWSLLAPTGRLVLSTPNGRLSQHRRERFRTPFHVDEYNVSEIGDLLREGASSIEFYGEYRWDHTDTVLHVARCLLEQREATKRGVESRANHGLPGFLLHVFSSRLNGPTFWRIRRCPDGSRDSPWFTTIVAVARR